MTIWILNKNKKTRAVEYGNVSRHYRNENIVYTDKKLEQALINNLQQFLLELGKGYAFVDRQQLLCTETNKIIAKYSVLNENKQLFVTKYLPCLPSEEELVAEIERGKELIRLQMDKEGRVWSHECTPRQKNSGAILKDYDVSHDSQNQQESVKLSEMKDVVLSKITKAEATA